jgi:hypothetical protein
MTKLQWDKTGERRYETGVDHGVLYIPNNAGVYNSGYAWNGLTQVTETPSGAESNKQYADNIVYLNLVSAEEFGGTIEAFSYPTQFEQCDGTASPTTGVSVGQQARKSFGMAYRTKIGTDLTSEAGYKLHLVYNALAAPSERAYATVNDSPEALGFSWEFSSTPVDPETNGPDGNPLKPTSLLTIDSTKVNATKLADLENLLYGTAGTDPSLPTPKAVLALFAGAALTQVAPVQPTYNSTTKVITIPAVTGVEYRINGDVVASGAQPAITTDTVVEANPTAGYKFPAVTDKDWLYSFS